MSRVAHVSGRGRSYGYVGAVELKTAVRPGDGGRRTGSAADFDGWTVEQTAAELAEPFTFVVGMDGVLRLAPRRSEHVGCAGGDRVLGAGEISFIRGADRWTVREISNQSTGYCPDVTSWSAVARALDDVELGRPSVFTHEVVFRRCPDCQEHNIVREDDFDTAPGGLRYGPGRDRPAGRGPRPALPGTGRPSSRTDRLPVLARVVLADGAGLRAGDLRGRHGRVGAGPESGDHPQPAIDGGVFDPQSVRRPGRVDESEPVPARARVPVSAPAQRPRHRGSLRRTGAARRGRPHRGVPVRQRRAHRQRLPGHPGAQPDDPGRGPADRLLRHRLGPRGWRRTAPGCRCTSGTRTRAN